MVQDAVHPLKRLSAYGEPYRQRVWAACICSILNKIFDLAPPVLIGAAVDVVVEREASLIARLGVVDLASQLWVLAAATVLIWGMESVFEYAYKWLWQNLAQTVQHDLRVDTYAHVQRLQMAWFEERSTGELLAILVEDVNQLERFLDGGANDLIQVTTTALVIGLAFFAMAPEVAWMAMVPIPLVLWGSFRFQKRIAPRYAAVRERSGLLGGLLSNNLTGVATIKSFVSEEYEIARVRRESDAYRQANRTAIRLSAAFSPLIRMAIVVGFTATLVYGGWQTLQGELAVGSYSVMVFLTQRLLWPMTRLGQTFDLYQRAMASTRRLFALLDTPLTIDDGYVEVDPDDVRGEIEFRGVGFSYGDGPAVLEDFNLKIPAGSTVAIVGSTGSGKSTLVRLLLRFYDATSGQILIDGQDVREIRMADLRRAVGLVSQQVFLFAGSVSENVAYGTFDVEGDAVERASRLAEAHEFVARLAEGYGARIGERGQKLSGGQRQRLSIARAILKDPPVLVLDEATSAVDNETEAAIQRSLDAITQDRTTVIIAHRLSTIRHADNIVVLDGGKVSESGTHEALVAKDGLYAQLWRVQTGDAS